MEISTIDSTSLQGDLILLNQSLTCPSFCGKFYLHKQTPIFKNNYLCTDLTKHTPKSCFSTLIFKSLKSIRSKILQNQCITINALLDTLQK